MAILPTTDGSETRRAERQHIDLPCSVRFDRADHAALVVDISCIGARIAGGHMPGTGSEVVLAIGRVEIVATIAWSTATACGLAFHRPLRAPEIDAIVRVPTRREKFWTRLTQGMVPAAG